jgi:PAS domain S-box-containing protein
MTHEHCYLGIASLVLMHFLSDLAIGLSYVAISLTLTLSRLSRRAATSLSTGSSSPSASSSSPAAARTSWKSGRPSIAPVYWLAGYLKLITAVASVATALVLPPLIPRTLALVREAKLSGARRDELERANRELESLYLKIKELAGSQSESYGQHGDLTRLAGEVGLRQREMQATLSALRETNQTLEAIIHASPLGIVALDREGVVKTWNRSAERIYGWSAAEVLGRMLPTVPPDKLEEMRRNHRQAVAGEDFTAFETVRLRKDGARINVSISTAPLRDAAGRTNGVVGNRRRHHGARARRRREGAARRRSRSATPPPRRDHHERAGRGVGGLGRAGRTEPAHQLRQRLRGDPCSATRSRTGSRRPTSGSPSSTRRPRARGAHRRADVRERSVGTNEFRWVTKDGRAVWVEAHSVAIRDEAGRPVGMRGVTMDITARKRAEEELRRWEQIFQHAGWGVALGDPQTGTLAAVNPAFARMHGYTVEEMRGTPLADTFAPEERARLAEHVRAVHEKGHHVYESTHIRKGRHALPRPRRRDGLPQRARRSALPRRQHSGHHRAQARRRGRALPRRRDDDARLLARLRVDAGIVARLAVPYVADYCLVHMLEDDGSIRRMIVAHQDPAREAAWRDMQRRFPLDLNTPHTIAKVLRTGRPELFSEISDEVWQAVIRDPEEIRMLREFDIRAAMIMPLAARGRTIGSLTFISSESARRYGEDDFALAGELARRAALAIDNARLYRRAQEANHAKDEFLATLSHELRTPLTPIIGWVHMMSGGQLAAEDMTHGLAVIGKNSQSLSRLINDLLDMSAILSGKMRIDTLPVSLRSVVGEAIETVRPRAAERNIRIELAPAAQPPPSPKTRSSPATARGSCRSSGIS